MFTAVIQFVMCKCKMYDDSRPLKLLCVVLYKNVKTIIIIIILVIIFIQGIYNCIPETNHVSRVYSVAAVFVFTICVTCNIISPMKCLLLLLLFEFLTSQLSAGKHSPILGFNNQQE